MDDATMLRVDHLYVVLTAQFLVIGAVPVCVTATEAVGPGIEWQQPLGGSGTDSGESLKATADGGCILAGSSTSSASGNVLGTNHGAEDVWMV